MKMATSAVLAAGLALTLLIAATGCGSDSSTSTESGAAEDSEAEETTTTEQTTTTVDVEAAKAEVDAEVEAACAAVAADPTLDPETLVPIQKREWSAAGILSTAVEQRIQKCADEAVEAAFAAIEAAEAQAEAAAAANAGPADIDAIVKLADNDAEAVEIYAASCLAIDPDDPAEQAYLSMLAARLKLAPELKAGIEQEVAAAAG